jgi:hypothetical protein
MHRLILSTVLGALVLTADAAAAETGAWLADRETECQVWVGEPQVDPVTVWTGPCDLERQGPQPL